VTNGVHTPTWDSPEADELWTLACGKDRWRGELDTIERELRERPESDVWNMRQRSRKALVEYLRKRLARQLAGHGGTPDEVAQAGRIFDPDALTIGFARRFASYKRPNLLLKDPERLLRILTNRRQPVQLVLAGKAHPQDADGQRMIREWVQFIRRTPARSQAVFLSDYDMGLTERLVQGVDLWLNTPRRPWEASGTSGMKVLVNGGLNLSELDGWWVEAYSPEVGWALGDGQEHEGDPGLDDREADQLYSLLEREIVPEFYNRDQAGVPAGWVRRMRESMSRLTAQFSANRAAREYTEQHYLPLAKGFRERSANGGASGLSVLEWQRQVEEHWARIRFGALEIHTDGGRHSFAVQLWVDELGADAVRVELYADGVNGGPPLRETMTRGHDPIGAGNAYTWTTSISADRPASDFTARAVPWHPAGLVPLECSKILWYR
jgi:starch phosphorylase